MNEENLSIDISNKISRLEKENKQLEAMIIQYDTEVNKQYKAIKSAIQEIKRINDSYYEDEKMYIELTKALAILGGS